MKEYLSFIKDLEKLISYKSVQAPAKEGMPFGKNVYDAYAYFMSIAKGMGFNTINYDNYMGEIIFGTGTEIGIIGHLDVVPEGDGWNSPPYTLTELNDKYYARGIMDDKAPLLMCLYILKELKESNAPVNKKFRIFVGCNEESGWADVEYFKTKASFPEYGFSPDGDFPVSYAEKGINKITFTLEPFKYFSNIKGGTVVNSVCGRCVTKVVPEKIDRELLKKHGLNLIDDCVIESIGKSCHGSCPQLGINAIKKLFEYMLDVGEDISNPLDCLFNDKFNLSNVETPQGKVTFSPNLIYEENGKIKIVCDLRIPAPKTLQDILPIFDKFNIPYIAKKTRDPLYVPKDSEFVQVLLDSYNQTMNQNLQPVSLSGGTFASVFKKGCAFGPEFIDDIAHIHEPNESVSKENLLKMYQIYRKAIFDLNASDKL